LRPLAGGDESELEAESHMAQGSVSGAKTTSDRTSHPQPKDPAGSKLADALAGLRDDLGFETASVFVPGSNGWQLLDREGPTRPWHAVLDPAILEGTPIAAEYADSRTVPGFGARLARLGCASLASLPLPEGGRVLLDSGKPCRAGGWIERARPYLSLVATLSGPSWPASGALRSHEEVATLDRLFAACQAIVAARGATAEQLVEHARQALRSDEIFLVSEKGADLEVLSSPAIWPKRLPRDIASKLDPELEPSLSEDALRRLAVALGVSSRAFVGAFGRAHEGVEILLAGWTEGPALSPISMAVAARAVSIAKTALQVRHQAVSSILDRERVRMAYALHDGLTQTVAGAVLELEALRKRIERNPADAVSVLETSKTEIRKALAELRGILFDLSPPTDTDDRQPDEPLTRYVEDVVRRWKLPARVAVEGDLGLVPPRILSVAYVVIREALTNAAKHASGTNVTVRLTANEGELAVMVGDGGRGFSRDEEAAARLDHHLGLDMLRRRVGEVGGKLRIESRHGRGTRVIATIPIEKVAS
jgi:signal transduction histidine kinase